MNAIKIDFSLQNNDYGAREVGSYKDVCDIDDRAQYIVRIFQSIQVNQFIMNDKKEIAMLGTAEHA